MSSKIMLSVSVTVACMTVSTSSLFASTIIDTVSVGNAGNAGDTEHGWEYGAVDYVYNIGTFEVTAAQYTEFLNAVAATDTYGLYSTEMWDAMYGCKIQRSGSPGSYSYSVAGDWADRPVNLVSWGDAARFANWLHNGQPTGGQNLGTTEDGSYFVNGATSPLELQPVTREPDATWVIPSDNEWYKAAYYDGGSGVYYDYSTGTDSMPSNDLIDPDPGNNANFCDDENVGNCVDDQTIGSPYYRTEVGDFENSQSPYGTFDQCGNVWEWSEAFWMDEYRNQRGGCFQTYGAELGVDWFLYGYHYNHPPWEYVKVGFRVAQVLESDCNGNGIPDGQDIADGTSQDCQPNGVPDECDIDPTDPDGDGAVSPDVNGNGIPDECEGGSNVGLIVAWGDNGYGQCNVPAPNTDFVAVAAGGFHSLGVKTNGSIVAWGRNNAGQCTVPAPNAGFVAVAGGDFHSLGLKANGSIVAWGRNNNGQCNVPAPNEDFVAVAAGYCHSLGLKANGSIVAWGCNGDGQCNVPAPNSGFVAVAAGNYHSLGVKAAGSIVAWGSCYEGQCNVPAPNSGFVAGAGAWDNSSGLKVAGSIVAWGRCYEGQCNVPPPNTGFVALEGGGYHNLGLNAGGSIVAWGWNAHGQCNVPAPNNDFVAVAGGNYHSLGLKVEADTRGDLDCDGDVDIDDLPHFIDALLGNPPAGPDIDQSRADMDGDGDVDGDDIQLFVEALLG